MSKLYEIVQLSNGDIALQNDDLENGESLITMKFSAELKNVLHNADIDLAKVMVEAGLEFVAKLAEERAILAAEKQNSDAMADDTVERDDSVNIKNISSSDIKNNSQKLEKNTTKNKNSDIDNELQDEQEEEMVSHLVH
ncbi:MAG: hypothetical protein ACRBCS_01975 [Cellvibrionaceae bacterium]